jgi:hypothetical protein
MWRQVFRELRALTNDKTIKVNPLQLNELYDHLWNVGELLTTDSCLELFHGDFRPWPKHPLEQGGDKFYAIHDRNKVRLTYFHYLVFTIAMTPNPYLFHCVGCRLGSASRL